MTDRKGRVPKSLQHALVRRFAEEHAVSFGAAAERRVLSVLEEDERRPPWFLACRIATREEDGQGIDIVVTTDVGDIFLQVKSSRSGLREFCGTRKEDVVIPLVVIIAFLRERDSEIRERVMAHLTQFRAEIRAVGSREAWIARQAASPPGERTAIRPADALTLNVARFLANFSDPAKRPTWIAHCRIRLPQDGVAAHVTVVTPDECKLFVRVAATREQFDEFNKEDARSDAPRVVLRITPDRTDESIRRECLARLKALRMHLLRESASTRERFRPAEVLSRPQVVPFV